ncbi:stage II sporulation protein M [Chryseolinea sp. H1M3-3]|uniref:stage II sporulation protein M n=1 Tax=Chryseolinea sp. H1M3-3 TaxID=3034144 RepID=UPI0023EB8095|nr:stage II sporulation protein M [Chryseolinea sp. H1M3-3]
MREAAFIKQSKSRWEEFEKVIRNPQKAEPDRLAELFIQLTDDLSFARTQYPESRTTRYLNDLASKVHLEIYKNKKEDKNRFITFWKEELPSVMYEVRKPLLYALIIFLVAGVMGAVSARYDDTFVRLILGDDYVNMTLENIKSGNPTNVYADADSFNMFLQITWNNIFVSFRIFAFGVLASLGTAFMLFYNAMMVGTFIMLFFNEGELSQALPVIMLHGTIELSSIVIAAAAGFTMGNSLLFPGTYSRLESFKTGAVKGLKIVIGLVPFFIIAGFIESFVTRYAFMPGSMKVLIIGLSALLMIYYFLIYPIRLKRHGKF